MTLDRFLCTEYSTAVHVPLVVDSRAHWSLHCCKEYGTAYLRPNGCIRVVTLQVAPGKVYPVHQSITHAHMQVMRNGRTALRRQAAPQCDDARRSEGPTHNQQNKKRNKAIGLKVAIHKERRVFPQWHVVYASASPGRWVDKMIKLKVRC